MVRMQPFSYSEYMISIKSHIIIRPGELRLKKDQEEFVLKRAVDDSNFLKTIYKSLDINYVKFYKMDGLSRLGFLAAEYLLKDETIEKGNCDLLFINKHASLAVDNAYQKSLSDIPSPGLFVYTLSNIVQGEICIRHKLYGENYTFVEKLFSPEKLFERSITLLNVNKENVALVACMDYKDDNDYELIMFFLVRNSYNQLIKYNLQNLKSIFELL